MLPPRCKLLLTCIVSVAALAYAQPADHAHQPPSVRVNTPDRGATIRVAFSEALNTKERGDLALANIKLKALPSETELTVPPPGAEYAAGNPSIIIIPYSGDLADNDTEVEVHFAIVHFRDGHTESDVKAAGPLLTPAKIIELKKADLAQMQKVPTTSKDRNIFASGFVTTASQGTQGGADVNLNSIDLGIPGLNSFLQIKKSSVNGADPKNFEAGGRYRATFLWGRSMFDQIRTDLDTYRAATTDGQRAAAMSHISKVEAAIQQRTIAATLLDFAFKIEGEATKFNISNGVGDAALRFQSMTKTLGGSSHGFWRFQIVGGGFEGGRNLNTAGTSPAETRSETGGMLPNVNWLARIKTGADLSLFYDNPSTQFPFKHVELEAGGVERYLFFQEPHFDNTSKTVTNTGKGSHPWGEIALKVFIGESQDARYGFKFSWQRGSLPPVFADTKALNFGFLYETKSPDEKK